MTTEYNVGDKVFYLRSSFTLEYGKIAEINIGEGFTSYYIPNDYGCSESRRWSEYSILGKTKEEAIKKFTSKTNKEMKAVICLIKSYKTKESYEPN